MSHQNLTTPEELHAAIKSIGGPSNWGDRRTEWIHALAETITWVRSADDALRTTRDFQWRLWEENHVAAVGQGNIRVDEALNDEGFRRWLAAKSLEPLPPSGEARLRFLTSLYGELKTRVLGLLTRKKVPHLKIFRVMAALYPEAMTSIASGGMLQQLARAMGSGRRLDPVERHLWVRERVDAVLGDSSAEPVALAERLSLPWMLYERFVKQKTEDTTEPDTRPDEEAQLVPLPAVRRRRGLTAIRGLFPGMLSTLEFVRDGVTRDALLDFLRASSPESKASSLGVTINSLQGELGTIRLDGDRYVLTERGEDVLESQDPNHLADWILTRILGADRAITELNERGPLPPGELVAAVRSMNPGWTSDFAPQALVAWLRSMGVVETTPEYKHALTSVGREWASRVSWKPEPLPSEPDTGAGPAAVLQPPTDVDVALPELQSIIASVQVAGHFPATLLARLHAGLWSHHRRHFAILTGLSGSGKTLLAREYASAITQGGSDRQRFTLPVQPGWYDPGALLGFTNPLRGDSYVRTMFLEFLIAAAGDPGQPYVAVLDEMNLSHPEQYMAPLLSAMETGDVISLHTEGDFFDGVPGSMAYPKNLVLIGTVNMDETTHGLSDKVLDRAFVLEFWDVDIEAYPHWGTKGIEPAYEKRTREVLTALMQALSPARLHFGWRVVDDVLEFLGRAATGKTLSFDVALDAVIYSKVLPKLRGEDSPRFREALASCEKAMDNFGLQECRGKVVELIRDVETTGSARFWR